MKYLFVVFAMIISSFSYGETFSESGLTDEQVNKIKKFTAELKLTEAEKPPISKAQEISEWVNVGQQIGQSLAGCAKELGVEVNNFVQTPVGKTAAIIIVWKLVGRELMHFGFGVFFFLFCSIVWIYLYRRMCIVSSIKMGEKKYFWQKRSVEIDHYGEGSVDGTRAIMMVVALVIVAVTLFTIFY